MHGSHLAIKRSHSECLSLSSGARIYSPSPIKKTPRVGFNVARELLDMPPRIDEFDFECDEMPIPGIFKAKSCIFRSAVDSSNEWSSESGLSGNGIPGESESPSRTSNRNPMSQDTIFEDATIEIPSRTSNPIVFDTKFKRYDQKNCGFPFYSLNNGIDAAHI